MSNSVNLKTKIGNIELESPFFNASGCWCTDNDELNQLLESDCCGVITKTITLNSRVGNIKPRYFDNTYLSVNSMGLPNMGYDYYKIFLETFHKKNASNKFNTKKRLFYSVSTMNINDTLRISSDIFDNNNGLSGIEFNVSCPNLEGKGQLAYNLNELDEFLRRLNENELLQISRNQMAIGLKMSPYFDQLVLSEVSDVIKKYPRIDFLTCINGIGNGLVVDFINEKSVIKPNNGLGGLGGSVVKPIGLSNVYQFKKNLGDNIDIIGCGGVSTGIDAYEYILSGASCVSVGTQLMKSTPTIFTRLKQDLISVMNSKNLTSLKEFKNKLN